MHVIYKTLSGNLGKMILNYNKTIMDCTYIISFYFGTAVFTILQLVQLCLPSYSCVYHLIGGTAVFTILQLIQLCLLSYSCFTQLVQLCLLSYYLIQLCLPSYS